MSERKVIVSFKVDARILREFERLSRERGFESVGECLREFMRRFIECNRYGLSWDLSEPLKIETLKELEAERHE
jgi:metal-responsive CopG/Arc/MetJ family transcriptional regulator